MKNLSKAAVLMLILPAIAITPASTATPPPADCAASDLDVLFVLDTTGSMGGVLQTVKDEAASIMADVLLDVPNAQFGAAHYEDYAGTFQTSKGPSNYGASTDTPWNLVQSITSTTSNVDSAIQGIGLGAGSDGPESLVRALHESHQAGVGWRANSMQIVILFTDAPGHDEDFAGYDSGPDPGPDAVIGTSDDLDFQTVVQDLVGAGTHVIAIQSGNWDHATQMLAHAAAETDGIHVPLSGAPNGDLGAYIRDLILSMAPQSAMAEAYDLYVGLEFPSIPASVLVDRLNLQQAPSGGSHDQFSSSFSLGIPTGQTLTVDIGLLHSEASRNLESYESEAFADASIEQLKIMLDTTLLLEANTLDSWAHAKSQVAATTKSGQAEIAYLNSDLTGLLPVSYAPVNVVVPLVNGGQLILGEQVTDSTPSGAWLESNAIHLTMPLVNGASLEIIVGHAFAGATCQDERTWTWTPPTDDPIAPDCILQPPVEETAGNAPVAGAILGTVLGQWHGVEIHICQPCTPTGAEIVSSGSAIPTSPECNPCPPIPPKVEAAITAFAGLPEVCDDDPGQPLECEDPIVSSLLNRPTCIEWPEIPRECEDFIATRSTADLKSCLVKLQV